MATIVIIKANKKADAIKETYTGVSITGLPASGANTVQSVVDFGSSNPEETTAHATVAAPWVTANSILFSTVVPGQDHTGDEIAAEQVFSALSNINPGVGFDVVLSSANGSTGKFLVNIVGF